MARWASSIEAYSTMAHPLERPAYQTLGSLYQSCSEIINSCSMRSSRKTILFITRHIKQRPYICIIHTNAHTQRPCTYLRPRINIRIRIPLQRTVGLGHDVSVQDVEVLIDSTHVILQVLPLCLPRKVANIHTHAGHAGGTAGDTATVVARASLCC